MMFLVDGQFCDGADLCSSCLPLTKALLWHCHGFMAKTSRRE